MYIYNMYIYNMYIYNMCIYKYNMYIYIMYIYIYIHMNICILYTYHMYIYIYMYVCVHSYTIHRTLSNVLVRILHPSTTYAYTFIFSKIVIAVDCAREKWLSICYGSPRLGFPLCQPCCEKGVPGLCLSATSNRLLQSVTSQADSRLGKPSKCAGTI